MKNFGTVLIACLSVTACAICLPDVPAPATSDMETTTNKVFAAGMLDGKGDFVLTADFATTSNTLIDGFTPSDWTALRVTQRGDLSSIGLSSYISVSPEKVLFILR